GVGLLHQHHRAVQLLLQPIRFHTEPGAGRTHPPGLAKCSGNPWVLGHRAAADRLARMDGETGPRPSGAAVARSLDLVCDAVRVHADCEQPHQQFSLSIPDGRTRGTVLSTEYREESHAARYRRWR